ncbi:MAG: branched-chain amino acid ABC transporter permease [Burkholderiaceae bacterium]
MSNYLELMLNGLMLGSLYALFALGLSLSLGVMKMINLAHGDLILLGAYVASVCATATGMPVLATLLAVLPVMFVLGWVLQKGLLNRVVGSHPLAPLLVTFGLSVVIQNLLLEVFTANTRSLPSGQLAMMGLKLGEVSVGVLPLLITGVSLAIYAITHAIVARTHAGRQARAVSDDAATARLVGVNDKQFFALMAGFVMAVTGLAAVLRHPHPVLAVSRS